MPSPPARSGWSGALSEVAGSPGRVEVEGLTWRPIGRREPVLRDLRFTVAAGERVLLAGPSGSGKSTLLRALAGLLTTVDAGDLTGRVTLDGHEPGSRAGEVGLVLQEPGAGVVASTIERDVAFGLENTLVPRGEMPSRIAAALAAVGLDLPTDTPTNALSGGQTQRLALAGTLALEPTLLLLDEPTAMLDPTNAARVRDVVRSVLDETHLTCVVVEHRIGPWLEVVDRLVVLDADGRLVVDGPAREMLVEHHDRLLDMGLWLPGIPPPEPLTLDLGGEDAWSRGAGVEAGVELSVPLRVERTVRTLDGATREVPALEHHTDLTGSDIAVVGPSGSGKSTLLHTVAGFLTATEGAVTTADGRPIATLNADELPRVIAWVPQWSSSAIVATSVIEELLTTSRRLGDESPETEQRAHHVLAALGLARLAEADPRQVSGGEQRRIALAAAVLHHPAVLLSDEPTVGQDRHTWAAVVGLLEAHRRAGGATITSTHDEALIERTERVVQLTAPTKPPPPARPRRPLLGRRSPLALLVATLLAVPAGILSTTWQTGLLVLAVELGIGAVGLWAPKPSRRLADGRPVSTPADPSTHISPHGEPVRGTNAADHGRPPVETTGQQPPDDAPRPRRRWRRFGIRLLPGLLAAVSVAWSTWWLAGHDVEAAATVALRVLVIVVPSALLIPWIDPDALGDHLAQRLRLPARPVVAVAAALARVHTFGDIWTEIGRARRVRGLGVSWRSPASVVRHLGALTMGLLVRVLRAAADLAVAMDSRGFAGARRRTWFAPAPWAWPDGLLVLLAAVPLAVAILH